jgi:long-chain acyl-CoA synthetase
VSTPEVGDRAGQPYLSADRRDADGTPCLGRGEIAVRGNNEGCGYYLLPGATAEAFRSGGWFYTGDIGQFTADGCLRIVDRKKNLVKLKGGEYIALEKMEAAYGGSRFVDASAGGICCYGDGDMDRPVAIVQLNLAQAAIWARDRAATRGSPPAQLSRWRTTTWPGTRTCTGPWRKTWTGRARGAG